MDTSEYLAFIPLLIYGIAVADLLGQWRRFFDRNYLYLPYFITTIMFTEVAVWNIYSYLDFLESLGSVDYFQYWMYLVQPMIFLLIVSALTPEPEIRDTEQYFKQRMPLVFGLMAVFVLTHTIAGLGFSQPLTFTRLIIIAVCATIAVTRSVALIYVLVPIWLTIIVLRV